MQLLLFPLEARNADEDEGPGLAHHPSLQGTHDEVDYPTPAGYHRLDPVTVARPKPQEERTAIGPGDHTDQQEQYDPGTEWLVSLDRARLHRRVERAEQE